MNFFDIFTTFDIAAFIYFLVCWAAFTAITDFSRWKKHSISFAMNEQRKKWMHVMAKRELRMVDTAIIGGLQHGTAFFASSCLLAIGGCFALVGVIHDVASMYHEDPVLKEVLVANLEFKLLGLTVIFAYSFFKFGWAYRLFNYCSIIIGATPHGEDGTSDELTEQIDKATKINVLGGKHFNAGLRGIFFSLGYIGWFIGPWMFVAVTSLIVAVMVRRQYFSRASTIIQS